jgi:hypothetical protein
VPFLQASAVFCLKRVAHPLTVCRNSILTLGEVHDVSTWPAIYSVGFGAAIVKPHVDVVVATPEAPTEPVVAAAVDTGEGPRVKIHVHIRCTADEIEDLAPRLKTLLGELSGPSRRE